MPAYTHGYSPTESQRLLDQAASVAELLHRDSRWPAGTRLLEAGCGVGAQTRVIAPTNPDVEIVAVDISPTSVAEARQSAVANGLTNVEVRQADLFALPFGPASFDHALVCFVLEHLADPVAALRAVGSALRPGGTVTVIEGDHGSTYFHPDSAAARRAIAAQVELQRRNGGDADIGRRVYPLLVEAGYRDCAVSPRQVYVDDSRPDLVEGFTRNTFTAMIQGIAEPAVAAGIASAAEMEEGVHALLQTTRGGGTFCYTFFRGTGVWSGGE